MENARRLAKEHTNNSKFSSDRGNMGKLDLEEIEAYARKPDLYVQKVEPARQCCTYASRSFSKETRYGDRQVLDVPLLWDEVL